MNTKPALKSSLTTVNFYNVHARDYYESTVHFDLGAAYDRFLKHLAPGAHILDAGCGSGRDTRAFLNQGYRVTAIDASPELASLATALSGQSCQVLLFEDMQFQSEFDGIWACASLLHIPKSEMNDVIFRLTRALKTGGIFYISLKEGETERLAPDGRFFSDYTVESFRNVVAEFPELHELAFWKTEEIRSQTHCQPWLNFLLTK